MNQAQQARLAALHRVRDFMTVNADALGDVNESTSRAALDVVLAGLEARSGAQGSARTQAAGATGDKNVLREVLRVYHMKPVATIARAALAHMPLITKLRLPSSKVNDSELVAAAHAMADSAAPYSDVFIAERLAVDFIQQLHAAAEAVRKAAVQRDGFQRLDTQHTQGVSDTLMYAANVMKVLDVLVVTALRDRPDLVAGWRLAKHPKAKPGVPQGSIVVPVLP